MKCNECKRDRSLAGQAFTEWTCKGCGKTFTHHNTAVPKYCPECSEKLDVCEECGYSLLDVSDCEYSEYELEEDGNYYHFCKIAPVGCSGECRYIPDCYYKQLKAKTLEIERIKKKLEATTNNVIATLEVAAKAITELNQIKETIESEDE